MARRLSRMAPVRLAAAFALSAAALHAGSSSRLHEGPQSAEFSFVRLRYADDGLRFAGREHWLTDWPDAEHHLLNGIRRLTRIDAGEPHYLEIMDEALFDYPWLYAVEVGRWRLSDEEAARLREYLLRGGFLVVDDFHGTREWTTFVEGMHRIFPDRPIVDIPPDDAVFRVAYELDEHVQIPGIQSVYSGQTYERDGYTPHWRGVYDDDGRLMVVINFNMDLGDAWEHADFPEYSLLYTTRAYKYAINYVLYAMTH